jgi:hypothetical protein
MTTQQVNQWIQECVEVVRMRKDHGQRDENGSANHSSIEIVKVIPLDIVQRIQTSQPACCRTGSASFSKLPTSMRTAS